MITAAVIGAVGVFGIANFWPFLRYYLSPVKEVSGSIKPSRINQFTDGNGKCLVSLVLGSGRQDEVTDMVKKSVDLIGGIEKLDVSGKTVILKPNLNSNDPYPASTNPEVVRGMTELLYSAGASQVIVGDMSFVEYNTFDAMKKSGIKEAAEEAGASTVNFEDGEWVSLKIPEAKHVKELLLAKQVYDADVLIDLPVIKTHSMASYTMSMKNFVGSIHPKSRMTIHWSQDLEEAVAELNLTVHPDLTVMDGTKSMVAGGPLEGTVRDTNVLVASGDRIANDIVGLSIVKMYGLWEKVNEKDVWEQTQIKKALELGIGRAKNDMVMVSSSFVGDEQLDKLVKDVKRISGI